MVCAHFIGAFIVPVGLWWMYFDADLSELTNLQSGFAFGYMHFLVFGSAGLVAAGLDLAAAWELEKHREKTISAVACCSVTAGLHCVYPRSLFASVLHFVEGSQQHPTVFAVAADCNTPAVAFVTHSAGVSILAIAGVMLFVIGLHFVQAVVEQY